ncbi:hypothetical protein [Shewanella frigidimarina]|jgi:hypothetical protein|uniref:hypothetical protein n=1 Tax=Shewanella frigidimarina TaxID=56812 RepID=UPI003D7AC431
MIDEELVFDIGGYNIGIGILRIKDGCFKRYQDNDLIIGANRLLNAKRIISFNASNETAYDQKELRKILNLSANAIIPFKGTHDDMLKICYGTKKMESDGHRNQGYFGMNLREIYLIRFKTQLPAPDTNRGHLLNDVLATYQLWTCWREGTLLVDYIEDKSTAIDEATKLAANLPPVILRTL